MKILSADGRLPPSLARLLTLVWFVAGFFVGWFAYSNWALRGEADQLVEDAKEVQKIEKRFEVEERKLEKRVEELRREIPANSCLLEPVNILDRLRNESGEAR